MIIRNVEVTPEQIQQDVRQNIGYFTEEPNLRMGEADSAHGVVFGTLAEEGDVALKPFANLANAAHEQRNLERVTLMGLEALEPVRVAAGGLAAYLITRRLPGLRHLGQVNWAATVAQRKHLETVVNPALEQAADT